MKTKLKPCPYDTSTKCNLKECCLYCETYCDFLLGDTESRFDRLKDRIDDLEKELKTSQHLLEFAYSYHELSFEYKIQSDKLKELLNEKKTT